MQVFIVDHDGASSLLVEAALAQRQHRVTPFPDAEAAWGVCQNRLAPLIVLSAELPGMDGLELCRRIRRLPDGGHCVILLLTARQQPQDLAAILEAGANDYVTKPIEPALLAVRLQIAERMALDLQARRQAEAALGEGREAFELAVRGSQDGLWDAKVPAGERWYEPETPVWYSPRFKELLGFEDHEFANVLRSWTICFHPDDRERLLSALRRHVERGVPFDEECRMRTKLGAVRWFSVRGQAVWNAKGQVVRIAGSLRDLTERKALEEQLRQAQKMEAVARLATGLSHDFNNLLTIISGHSSMLMEDLDLADPHRASVEEIKRAGERAAALAKRLLAFNRKAVVQPIELDLNATLTRLTPALKGILGERQMVTSFAPTTGRVRIDPTQFEQVMVHLVANARDAMPRGGRLTIQTAQVQIEPGNQTVPPGDYATITVRDTGTGMDAATRARCFEPFFTTKRPEQGEGLGLATVYSILSQSHGAITVASEKGEGATFTIYLPSVQSADDVSRLGQAKTKSPTTQTVLLVEDEEALRATARKILEQRGYQVLGAPNGAEALRLWEQSAEMVDLLLTDLVMPGMSGRELARRLAAVRPSLKVLYMSGYPSDDIAHHGILDEGTPFIAKPFTPANLLGKVREILDRPAGR
jgi:two-component system, cell cycle sensor histidine kinase and response regulator CckA